MFIVRNLLKTSSRPIQSLNKIPIFSLPYFQSFSTSPSNAKYEQALSFIKQKNFKEGINHFEQVLQSFNNQQKFTQEDLNLLIQTQCHLGKLYSRFGNIPQANKLLTAALDFLHKSGSPQNIQSASLYNAIGSLKLQQREYNDAKSYIEKAKEILSQLNAEQDPQVKAQSVQNSYLLSALCDDSGKLDEALELLEGIIKQLSPEESVAFQGDLDLPVVYLSVGDIYLSTKRDIQQALKYWKEGLELLIKRKEENTSLGYNYCQTVAQILIKKRIYREAQIYAEKSLETAKKVFPDKHPKIADAYLVTATIYFHIRDFDKALDGYMHAGQIFNSNPEKYHDQIISTHLAMIEVFGLKGANEEAKFLFERTQELALKQYGPDNSRVADYYYFWAEQLRFKMKDYKEAKSFFTKALDIYTKNKETDQSIYVAIYSNLGSMFFDSGKFDPVNTEEALKYLHECVNQAEKVGNATKPLALACSYLGVIYSLQKNFAESIKYYEKGISINERAKDYATLDREYGDLAQVYKESVNSEKAIENYKKALELAFKRYGKENNRVQDYLADLVGLLESKQRDSEAKEFKKKYEYKKPLFDK